MQTREGGGHLKQEDKAGAPPEKQGLPAHGVQEMEEGEGRGKLEGHQRVTPQAACPPSAQHEGEEGGGGPLTRTSKRRHPPGSVRYLRTVCRSKGMRGGKPHQEGEGGIPPNQEHTPFLRNMVQEMGGGPQDLHSPPTAKRSKGDGERGEEQPGLGVGGGASTPLGGKGKPTEKD